MRARSKRITLLFFLILALFIYGIITLFTMRFEKGDVYPVYSSLRADPLGTKVFYESLDLIEGVSTTRNYLPLSQFDKDQQATIFYFGVSSGAIQYMDKEDVERLEDLIAKGSRFVLLLYPQYKGMRQNKTLDTKTAKNKQQTKDGEDDTKDKKASDKKRCGYIGCPVSLLKRWGVHTAFQKQFDRGEHAQKIPDISGTVSPNLPESVSWNSSLYFDKVSEKWNKVYSLRGHPVLIERVYGRGTIVIGTDSYFVSNENLLKERYPKLLSWIVGDNETVIFDETHFGIRENPGIAALARKYRLHGMFAGILFFGILFIWKNSFSLVPNRDVSAADSGDDLLVGKDYVTGFVSLLRKNIAPRDILKVCFREWKRSFPQREKEKREELKNIQAIVDSYKKRKSKQQDIVRDYQKINKILRERKLR